MIQPRKNNKKNRDFKSYLKFLLIALAFLAFFEFIVFKGERPYVQKYKNDYKAEQLAKQKALEEALPPEVVFPEDGEEYFESAPEIEPEFILKDEQSLLPEKKIKFTKLRDQPKEAKPKQVKKPSVRNTRKGDRPKIVIVIDDVGMNIKQSRAAIDLPAEVTLAMLPYAENVRSMAKKARKKGHELIIHTPMEAVNKDVPLGGLALRSEMDKAAFEAEFTKIANSFEGYTGINNHMGSRLTQDKRVMGMVMSELKKRNLYFLDSRTISTSIAAETASLYGVPNITRDVFLDHEDTPEFVNSALKKTENFARKYGSAIAIGHPKANTMSALRQWIPTLEDKGFELVTLSNLISPNIKISKVQNSAPKPTTKPRVFTPNNISPSAGDDGSQLPAYSELSVEEERVIIKPIELQQEETGTFIIREPHKTIQMEQGLPRISYPVNN